MKTIKITLTTLVTVLISLTGFSQKPSDPALVEKFNQKLFDSLIVEKMIELAPNYGFTLEKDSIMNVVSTKVYDATKSEGKFTDDETTTYDAIPHIYNNPKKLVKTGVNGGIYLFNKNYTYDSKTTTIAQTVIEEMLDTKRIGDGDVIFFSYKTVIHNFTETEAEISRFVVYVTEI